MDYTSESYNRTQYAGSGNLDKRISIYRFNTNPENWYDWVFRRLDLRPGERALECASGNGALWKRNIERIPVGAEVTLSDLNEAMLGDCRANLAEAGGRFRFARLDLQALPAGLGPFSLVIANHVLYHLADLSGALSGIARALEPGGRFVATTIGREDNKELGELLRAYSPAIEFDHAKVAANFGLENGGEILSRHFGKVELFEYENRLEIADAGAIFDYAMSLNGIDAAVSDKDDFRAFLERVVTGSGGRYIVTKKTGLFLARG
jgi:ubiquinone/menaquinone biosynthesis C-methylase UbiE